MHAYLGLYGGASRSLLGAYTETLLSLRQGGPTQSNRNCLGHLLEI